MSTILAAHQYLAASILQGLAITTPIQTTIKRAYDFFPPPRIALPDLPCAMVTFEQRPVLFKPALIMKPYTMHIQIYAAKIEDETGPAKATAFLDALIQKISESATTLTLGGGVATVQQLRGETPETLVVFERAGAAYVGIDVYLDIIINQNAGYS